MTGTVVAGVDGSPASIAAAHWAAREAERRAADLRLLRVVPPETGRGAVAASAGQDRRTRPGGGSLEEAAVRLRHTYRDVVITTEEVAANPLPGLVAAGEGAGLLVLGSGGKNAMSGLLRGSAALGAVSHGRCPVVLVRAGQRSSDEHRPGSHHCVTPGAPYRDVVLGLDLPRPAERAIAFAFDAASRRCATLRVIHSWNMPPPRTLGEAEAEPRPRTGRAAEEAEALETVLGPWRAKFPKVAVVAESVVGSAAGHLLDAEADASLLVLGHRAPTRGAGPHIGSVSDSVLHHAMVPVAVIPHADPEAAG
ncbi:universal stress protein [Actinacidiphila sp. ITFR-21]|uniref:universal stress protein n=1 Tax=Actinacidiphila sp. ITFR-21 TaxID=3075199 RepID=UPI0028892ED7|nr:universal stress protein [Streptomyces sp. ITFR-21]WNI14329.1 universal stress protein [Streptomyces sp. ITFR-21]